MGKLTKPLERFPLPPFLSLGLILILLSLAIIVPLYFLMKYKQECFMFWKKLLKPCLRIFMAGDGADGIDLSKVKLTKRTFYERVHPSVNELEFSAGDENIGKFGIKLGQVHFGLNYDNIKNILRIKIYEAKDLPAADEGGASDPYIRVMLLPDTKRRYETTVLDDTLDPVYNQEFAFNNLPLSELQKRKLCIRALDFDTFPQHDILGETEIPLIDLDLVKKHYTKDMIDFWRILVPGYDPDKPGEFKQSKSDYGDICVSLHYQPAVAKLIVYIIECKNLKNVDEGRMSDPFVKVTMLHNKQKKKSQKTRVIKQTLDPYYNEEMVFKLDPALAPITDIRFLVMDYNFPIGGDIIGEVVVGAHSYGPQKRQWRDMLKSQKKPIACWHMLRPKMNKGEED